MKGRAFVGLIAGFFVLVAFVVPVRVFAGNPPDQGKSTITSSIAPADGTTSSTVTITLKDSGGSTLSGNDFINITSSDSTASFNPSSMTLNGSGVITTQMKTTTVGSVPITVTDTSTSNTQLSWSVSFYQPGTNGPTATPTPAPGACTDAAPGSTVKLTSAASAGPSSITLTWTDAVNPVTYYLLSYGLSPGTYIYGVPNIGGQGTTSFTVGGLTTGKKYYFVVRAGNGCTPGVFSNEVSAIAGASPTPTFMPPDTSTDTISQSDSIPADTPELAAETPTPTPTEAIMPAPVSTSGSNPFVSRLMIGVTALGVLCAILGGVFYLRMKKR